MASHHKQGPLTGIRVIELAGIGPLPMAGMLLADLGATVLRIGRKEPVDLGVKRPLKFDLMLRGRSSIELDLKQPESISLVLRLTQEADAFIEGFRPGVTERLGLGPEVCMARNRRLVYGRMTGWGQTGPLGPSAGHDINYLSITGVLDAIGRFGGPPTPPLALVGDAAGGGLFLAFGVVAAILEARQSGEGQVIDVAMVDGIASLSTAFFGLQAAGLLRPERGTNMLDSGAPFYDVYQCSDGLWISIGPLEERFFQELTTRLELDPATSELRHPAQWPALRSLLASTFATRTRAQWCARLEGTDACFTPVLSFEQAPNHPHLKARGTFVEIDGVRQPAPAPRFSRTQPATPEGPRAPDSDCLTDWLGAEELSNWRAMRIIT